MVSSNCHRIASRSTLYESEVNVMLHGNCDSGESNANNHNEVDSADYQLLPRRFFKYKGIPPPLVRKSWLKSLYDYSAVKERKGKTADDAANESLGPHGISDGESSGEDSMPLSSLRLRLSPGDACRSLLPATQSDDVSSPGTETAPLGNAQAVMFDKQNLGEGQGGMEVPAKKSIDVNGSKSVPVIIQRRRGRPKKQNENVENSILDDPGDIGVDILNENDGSDVSWWNKDVDFMDNTGLTLQSELFEVQECVVDNYESPDYFEQANEESVKEKEKKASNVKAKKKKEGNQKIQGIKIENSKLVYPCMECGKSFSAPSTLKYHMRIHNGTLIKCSECDRGFTTNYLLKCHMRIHNGDLFMCHKCGRGFTTAELLKVHSRSHTGIRPYRCQTCGKSFPSASNLAQHKETHEPEKKYLCFQCGSSFTQKRCLDGHMLSHGEKNHICTVCGKLWARKSDLTEHMRVHTGYKPYACSSCPQKFTQASSLRRHQIVHKDTNPVQCLTCGKMLKCDEYYKRHMKKHEKEKEIHIAVLVAQ